MKQDEDESCTDVQRPADDVSGVSSLSFKLVSK